MLQYFAANTGRILTKQELLEAIWPNISVGEDSLFQCIKDIRNAIGDDRRQLIKVVSGRGYLVDAVITGAESLTSADTTIDRQHEANRPSPPVGPASTNNIAASPVSGSAVAAAPIAGRFRFSLSRRMVAVPLGIVVCVVGLVVAAPLIGQRIFSQKQPVISVTPIVNASADPQVALMASNLTDTLVDGLSKIPNIRVLAPKEVTRGTSSGTASSPLARADFILRGELQKTENAWTVQARIIDAATDEIRWTTSYSVGTANTDPTLQQSRLTAGLGYPLALHISAAIHSGLREGNAKIVVDQAMAFINRTSREKFHIAQEMLEKALATNPDNVDLQAALAAQLLRGIQTDWYRADQAATAEHKAKDLLERAVRAEPNYLPVLEGYCRFLTATNHFVESLVACAKTLTVDPWDGLVLFQVGLSQLQLGRFDDALTTFLQADHFDTPQVSRWTWLLGVGLTYLWMDRNQEAIPWLKRSLAITPGTGRTDFALAAAYQRLGQFSEAKAAIAAGMKLRPGSSADNVALPKKNASPIYLSRLEQILADLVAAGLPQH